MTVFYEKLNVKENKEPYQIEEEITMQSGRYEGFLQHDNVIESSIALYTGKKLTGEKVENFVLSVDENYPWRTFIRVSSAHEKLYLSYETIGDVIEADDINDLQKAVMKLEKDVASVDTSAFVTSEEFNRLKQSSLDAKTAHIQAIEDRTGQSSGLTTSSSWRDILYFWSNVVSSGSGSGGLNFASLFFKMVTFEKSFWNAGFQPSKLTVSELSLKLKNVRLQEIPIRSGIETLNISTTSKMILLIFKQTDGYTSSQGVSLERLQTGGGEKFQIAKLAIGDYEVDFNKPNKTRLITEHMNEIGEYNSLSMRVSAKQFLYIFPETTPVTLKGQVSWTKTEGKLLIFETDGFL